MGKQEIFNLQPLFADVQLQNIFRDGKTFVDCTPRFDLSVIQHKYEEQKSQQGFDLSTFVNEHFILPKAYSTNYVSVKGRPIVEHIEMLWNELTRQPEEGKSSLIPLPHPYIVPGGRFREIFYWDSYFTMLGLQISGRIDMIENMVDNFSYLIDKFGYIPNGNRTYFLGRSQPPFYASMIKLLSEEKGEGILIKYLPQLEKEYDFWMKGAEQLNKKTISINRVALMPDGNFLNHYWDEFDTPRPESYKEDVELAKLVNDEKKLYRNLRAACESGWDFSSRWFKNENDFTSIHTTEIIPVDLNCLLFNLEQTIAEAYQSNNKKVSEKYQIAANKRKDAMNKYCWDNEKGFYFDYDYFSGKQKQSLTLAGIFPLFFKIATPEQAEYVAKFLEQHFLCPGGLQTSTVTTPQQWDSPNGWAPLHWIAIQGLTNYGYKILAKDITKRWMSINEKVYNNTGKIMEKYNVVATDLEAGGGEYQSQDGFGWTNGVYLSLHKYQKT
ncbi:MAG: alpha,alpha-trehalase TreF [Chitinophagaceae bacterium]